MVEGRVVLEYLLDLNLVLVLDTVHLPVPPGQELLLVQMTFFFIPSHIIRKNKDKDD